MTNWDYISIPFHVEITNAFVDDNDEIRKIINDNLPTMAFKGYEDKTSIYFDQPTLTDGGITPGHIKALPGKGLPKSYDGNDILVLTYPDKTLEVPMPSWSKEKLTDNRNGMWKASLSYLDTNQYFFFNTPISITLPDEIVSQIKAKAEPTGPDTAEININLDWRDNNVSNKDITAYIVYEGQAEAIDPSDPDIYCIDQNTSNNLTNISGVSSTYQNIYKEIVFPAGTTKQTITVPCDKTKENIFYIYLAEDNNYFCSVPYMNQTQSNVHQSIDEAKRAIMPVRAGAASAEKNIVLAPKTKKSITITNNIEGGDREYSEFFLLPAYYLNNMKTRYNVAINNTAFETLAFYDNRVSNRLDLFRLDDADEPIDKEWFADALITFVQLTVPLFSNPNKLEKTIESITSQIEKANYAQGMVVFGSEFVDIESNVVVNKTDINNKLLSGAEFELYSSEGVKITDWTSTTKELSLLPGKYILKETKSPNGYIKGDDITFEVSATRNPKVDVTNKNTNDFFLADEKNIDVLAKYLPLDENDLKEASKLWLNIEEANLTKNDMRLAMIIAANTLYMGADDKICAVDVLTKEEILDEYKEFLNGVDMEELIPYLDNTETLFPIIKLKNGESITINEPVADPKDLTLFLYAKNYNDEGYEVNNRSVLLNSLYTNSDEKYDFTYTYTGKVKDSTFQAIKVSTGKANTSGLCLNVVNELEEVPAEVEDSPKPAPVVLSEEKPPVTEESKIFNQPVVIEDDDVAAISQQEQPNPKSVERELLARTDGELQIYVPIFIIALMSISLILRRLLRLLD